MSLIERALERLKRESAVRKGQQPESPASTATIPSIEPAQTGATASSAVSGNILATPCRDDRVLHVDVASLRASGVMPPSSEERRLAEEYRILKRPLLKTLANSEADQYRNLIAVTSALPGEGKTFTCINLALSLAIERGREVILVDGDSAKRHVTHLFGLDTEPGLLDAASNERVGVDQVVLRTDVPSLYVLPAGLPHAEATEILRAERTRVLLNSLASDPRRIVLIDCAPLLVTSESGVLAALAGQAVLVVKASETPQEVVMRAVEAIAEDKPVSLILNQVLSAPEHHFGYYYGGYGYGRPAYGSEPEAKTTNDESRSYGAG